MCLLVDIVTEILFCPCVAQGIALVSRCFKSITCMCWVIFSLLRWSLVLLFQTQDVFSR